MEKLFRLGKLQYGMVPFVRIHTRWVCRCHSQSYNNHHLFEINAKVSKIFSTFVPNKIELYDNMRINEESHITTIADVKAFFQHLVEERMVNFHPDDDFAEYISHDDKTPMFTDEEVTIYNRLMEESFDACEKAGVDIYNLGIQQLQTILKPMRFES